MHTINNETLIPTGYTYTSLSWNQFIKVKQNNCTTVLFVVLLLTVVKALPLLSL